MKKSCLFLPLVFTAGVASAEPISITPTLPAGTTWRTVETRVAMPIMGQSADDAVCTATISSPKFQFANVDAKSDAQKRLHRKWLKMALRTVNQFLLDVEDAEFCKSDFFTAQQIDLGFTFTSQLGNMVSMVHNSYWYGGGAHGLGGLSKTLLDFSTGKEIPGTLDTFLKSDQLVNFLSRVENKLLRIKDFDPSFGWDNYKAQTTEMSMIENFFFTSTGMTLYYNPYEIGSYAEGIYEVEFTWAEIKDLKNNSDYAAILPNG